ncbi:iron chelate uptake ABC transporter family permease subunit [Agrobacterium tumefaciens]|uniref:iron chelate uptake ABC transporter family permease subunit n=1 Tax=Agrobacterium tumefaciens TaxID=358 RepID=UPI0021CEB0CB|nr:iron chelate uptake ABC transporter family permease subunit [Agrobacterium tumefaciens]UXS05322.1 iron chelate uptake ABC transporter family permease subunit [Agrobacterium tumefaciens]
MEQWILLLVAALGAGALSGVIGTGASLLLLPLLVPMFGAVEAIPIMAVAGFMANLSRALAWWGSIAWKAVMAYALPGVPAAALGAYTLVHMPRGWPEMLLGLFIMALVPLRQLVMKAVVSINLVQMAVVGAVIGFLTGLFLSTGPLSVPAFLALGLVRSAFIDQGGEPSGRNMLGDMAATGLGVRSRLLNAARIAASVLLTCACASVVGTLGFVGLVAPHLAPLFFGSAQMPFLFGSAALGSLLVLLADTVGRTIFAPVQIPAGILMAVLGLPFFCS